MITIKITCDCCGNEIISETASVEIKGLSNNSVLFEHCCNDCKEELFKGISDYVKELIKRKQKGK